MARNVEIKARLQDRFGVEKKLRSMAKAKAEHLAQDDTFFNCTSGRLKLRVFADQTAELIYYQRTDQAGPKESFYVRTPIVEPKSFRQALALANGELGRVIKKRTVYILGRTRVHLDTVQGLGDYLELEVVLQDAEVTEVGEQEAMNILASLNIDESQLEAPAYLDLLQQNSD